MFLSVSFSFSRYSSRAQTSDSSQSTPPLQLHILCGRTGANNNVILAWRLDVSETTLSYTWFGKQCKAFGLTALIDIKPGPFDRAHVIYSDGFKGTEAFDRAFESASAKQEDKVVGRTQMVENFLYHMRCAKHLGNSVRAGLKEWKKKRVAVAEFGAISISLDDRFIYALYPALVRQTASKLSGGWRSTSLKTPQMWRPSE